MIGLFQENGPCHFVNGASTPSLNPYSFNNFANMLYVDQPIGVGFSYGTDDVTSTVTAAPYVWKLLQAFYAQFPGYESRDFGIFTEVKLNQPPKSIPMWPSSDRMIVVRRTLWPRICALHPAAERGDQVRFSQGRDYQPGSARNQQRLVRLDYPGKGLHRLQLQQHVS